MNDKLIYIVVQRQNDKVIGHALSTKEIDQEWINERFQLNREKEKNFSNKDESVDKDDEKLAPYPLSFGDVEEAFSQAMLMYRKSVVETINLAPILAKIMLNQSIEDLTQKKGAKLHDLSKDDLEVYTLPNHAVYSISRHIEESSAMMQGALHLPKIATIGLISSYDAILSDLLRVIFQSKPEIIFTSEREIKFSDLVKFINMRRRKIAL